MKNIIIAVVIIILLVLGFMWWKGQQVAPALETAPKDNGLNVELQGEVQGDWEATGKDGSAEMPQ